jgi:hypothetical protein
VRQWVIVLLTALLLPTQMLGASAQTEVSTTPDSDKGPVIASLPASDAARGVSLKGLAAARQGACVGMLEIVDVDGPGQSCTHGPDAAPVSIGDVRTADMTPQEAAAVAESSPPFVCDGDGISGRRVQAIYAVTPDRADRFAQYEAAFKGIIAGVQDQVRDSSAAHGSDESLLFRFKHTVPVNGSCEPVVDHVKLSSNADDDSFGATIAALKAKGYVDASRRYLIFMDANILCGIGQMALDDRPSPTQNWNNVLYQPMFSRVDAGCWDYAETHELVHNIGAVQDSAPHASGNGHCNDDHDLMCYADGGSTSAMFVNPACPSSTWERLLDCGGDDYFNPSPAAGSYLDTHWNIASSGWLFAEPAAPAPPQPAPPVRAPTVTITTQDQTVATGAVAVKGTASDADGDLRLVRLSVDGSYLRSVNTSGSWSSTINLAAGRRTVSAQAVDYLGRVSSTVSVELFVLAAMPSDLRKMFIDDNDSLFETDIARLAVQGVTRGCNPPTNDRFCPTSSVTRGQMAIFLVRALELPASSSVKFTDDNGSPFEAAIQALAAAGITRGCNPPSNTRFCPDSPVTRGQMAIFLVRALSLPASSSVNFTDDNGSQFEAAIQALAAAGITRGCNPPSNTRFCPDSPVSRGQMAAFLTRAIYS